MAMERIEPIEARFEWSADLLAEVDRMQNRSPAGRWRWLRFALALLFLFAVLAWNSSLAASDGWREPATALLFGVLIAGAGLWLLFRLRGPAWRRARLANSPQLHGETHMILDQNGVRTASAHVEASYRWSAFSRVARSDRAIGLQIGLAGWLAIPIEALDRPAEEALATIEAWRAAGRDADRPTVQRFE